MCMLHSAYGTSVLLCTPSTSVSVYLHLGIVSVLVWLVTIMTGGAEAKRVKLKLYE